MKMHSSHLGEISPQRRSDLTYNPDHNILELCNILVQIRFTISKRKLDIQYGKLGTRVASRVAERVRCKSLEESHSAQIRERSLLGHLACSEETQKKILESGIFRTLESEGVTEIGALYKVSPSKFVGVGL